MGGGRRGTGAPRPSGGGASWVWGCQFLAITSRGVWIHDGVDVRAVIAVGEHMLNHHTL